MNKQISNKVKEELVKNISCQVCGNFYDPKNVSIKSLGGYKNFINAYCEKCSSETQFEADIMEESEMEKKYIKEDNNLNFGKLIEKEEVSNNSIFSNKKNINGVIQEEEISILAEKMKNFSSFKNLFSLVLVFSMFFTGCDFQKIEETRQNILGGIENMKETSSGVYNESKEFIKNTKEIIETAPEKIENTRKEVEKIVEDANKLKKDLEKKVKDTKKAIDETKKAVDAVSNAMDSINAIGSTGNSETGTGENN